MCLLSLYKDKYIHIVVTASRCMQEGMDDEETAVPSQGTVLKSARPSALFCNHAIRNTKTLGTKHK